jgi:hypothetical protein
MARPSFAIEIERDDPAAPIHRRRPVEADERRPVGLPQGEQLLEEPSGQAAHPFVNRVDANRFKVRQPDLDGREREVVERAILERRFPFGQIVLVALDRCNGDGAAREPRATQLGERRLSGQEAADAGGIPKQLVEGLDHEIRRISPEIEPVRRCKGRCVEQHIPALRLRRGDPFERVLNAGEV